MKKFGFFAGLAGLAAVGGVFASWTFGQFSIDDSALSTPIVINFQVEGDISSSFKVVGSAASTGASYGAKQNASEKGFVIERTAGTDAVNDVVVTAQIVSEDYNPEIIETALDVKAVVTVEALENGEDSLADLGGVLATKTYEGQIVVDEDTLTNTWGFAIGDMFVEEFSIKTAAEAKAYQDAAANSKFSVAISMQKGELESGIHYKDGLEHQITEGTFTEDIYVENNSTLIVSGGFFGGAFHVEEGSTLRLNAGAYATAPNEAYVASGYELAANTDPFTKEDYPYSVVMKSFNPPVEDPEPIK